MSMKITERIPVSPKREIRAISRPWYYQRRFQLLSACTLVVLAFLLLPDKDIQLHLHQKLSIYFFVTLTLSWGTLFISDTDNPTLLNAGAAGALLIFWAWLFFNYSDAEWDKLGYVYFNMKIMGEQGWKAIWFGLFTTIEVGFFSCIFAFILGLFLAMVRFLDNKVLTWFVTLYVAIFRALPTIVLASLIYYALPFLGILFPVLISGILTLTLNHGAYSSEIFRAGIESIGHGQVEAARSLGMGNFKTFSLVIFPQAFRVIVPPLTSQLVALLKETAICSVIGIPELLRQAMVVQSWTANPTSLIMATLLYMLLLIPLTVLSRRLEKRLKKSQYKS